MLVYIVLRDFRTFSKANSDNVYHKKLSMWGQESYLTTRFALSSILKDNY